MAKGKVYLVGAGPGRPDLISVRGLNILKQAEFVLYDYLVDKQLLEVVAEGTELVCADQLGKKRYANGFGTAQQKINKLMVKKALSGKKVVRLKNGDPSIFGRLGQEIDALNRARIEFEIVPGITAASAAAAFAGVPLTDREIASSLVIVTGHEDPAKEKSAIDWSKIASFNSIILYMAMGNLGKIVKKLIAAGKSKNTPVAVVARAGAIDQKTTRGTLANIAEKVKSARIIPPAMIIVGEVVKKQADFNWLRKNKQVLFTGLSAERFFLSGTYFHLPLVKIIGAGNYREFDRHLKNINDFDWLVFSSRYGVEYFFKRLFALGYDTRELKGPRVAAVGQSTRKKLLEYGVRPDLVPQQESAKGLLARFRQEKLAGQKVFLPRSDLADKGLVAGLARQGARVTSGIAYSNVMPKNLPDLDWHNLSEVMFTSPSTVRNFKKRYKKVPKGIKIKWIGPVTKQEVKRQGIRRGL